jgi:hypothetical protein
MSMSVRLNGHLDLGKAYYKIYFATKVPRVSTSSRTQIGLKQATKILLGYDHANSFTNLDCDRSP